MWRWTLATLGETTVTLDPSVAEIESGIDEAVGRRIAADLVDGLEVEAEAVRTGDADLAATALTGDRLAAAEAAIAAPPSAERLGARYELETIVVRVMRDPLRPQLPPQIVLDAVGLQRSVQWDGDRERETGDEPFERTFLMALLDGRWLISGDQAPP